MRTGKLPLLVLLVSFQKPIRNGQFCGNGQSGGIVNSVLLPNLWQWFNIVASYFYAQWTDIPENIQAIEYTSISPF